MKRMNRVFYNLLEQVNNRASYDMQQLEWLYEDLMDYADLHPDTARDKYLKNRVLRMAQSVKIEMQKRGETK